MTLDELIEDLERRRAEAARHGYTARAAKLFAAVLEDLRRVDGTSERGRMMTTGEAADVLKVSPKTVRRWIGDGRLPAAEKTSERGEWRIPARDVYRRAAGSDPDPPSGEPRLWEPEGDGR